MQHILYKKHTNVLTLKSGLIESSQQKMTQWANVITTVPVAPQTTWLKKITQVKQLITKSNNLRKVHASCLFSFFCGAMFNKLLPSQPFFFFPILCFSNIFLAFPLHISAAFMWSCILASVILLRQLYDLNCIERSIFWKNPISCCFFPCEKVKLILLKLSEIHVWKLFLRKQRNTTIVQIKISL